MNNYDPNRFTYIPPIEQRQSNPLIPLSNNNIGPSISYQNIPRVVSIQQFSPNPLTNTPFNNNISHPQRPPSFANNNPKTVKIFQRQTQFLNNHQIQPQPKQNFAPNIQNEIHQRNYSNQKPYIQPEVNITRIFKDDPKVQTILDPNTHYYYSKPQPSNTNINPVTYQPKTCCTPIALILLGLLALVGLIIAIVLSSSHRISNDATENITTSSGIQLKDQYTVLKQQIILDPSKKNYSPQLNKVTTPKQQKLNSIPISLPPKSDFPQYIAVHNLKSLNLVNHKVKSSFKQNSKIKPNSQNQNYHQSINSHQLHRLRS